MPGRTGNTGGQHDRGTVISGPNVLPVRMTCLSGAGPLATRRAPVEPAARRPTPWLHSRHGNSHTRPCGEGPLRVVVIGLQHHDFDEVDRCTFKIDGTTNASTRSGDMALSTLDRRPELALVDCKEVARRLGVSLRWIHERTRRGEIPCYRFGTALRFDLAEVSIWLTKFHHLPKEG